MKTQGFYHKYRWTIIISIAFIFSAILILIVVLTVVLSPSDNPNGLQNFLGG